MISPITIYLLLVSSLCHVLELSYQKCGSRAKGSLKVEEKNLKKKKKSLLISQLEETVIYAQKNPSSAGIVIININN